MSLTKNNGIDLPIETRHFSIRVLIGCNVFFEYNGIERLEKRANFRSDFGSKLFFEYNGIERKRSTGKAREFSIRTVGIKGIRVFLASFQVIIL